LVMGFSVSGVVSKDCLPSPARKPDAKVRRRRRARHGV
jgi:hypothetical protein